MSKFKAGDVVTHRLDPLTRMLIVPGGSALKLNYVVCRVRPRTKDLIVFHEDELELDTQKEIEGRQ